MLAEPLLLLHTPTHADAHNTTQYAGCCGQQPTLAYTPCHVRQENYANLVTALPLQNSPAAAHAEVACTAFAAILMTTRKSTASSMYSSIAHSGPNNTVVAGYHDSRRNTDTPYRSLWRYICSSCARAGVFPGIPVYQFALFTGSFWSCHYRPVNRDFDCIHLPYARGIHSHARNQNCSQVQGPERSPRIHQMMSVYTYYEDQTAQTLH